MIDKVLVTIKKYNMIQQGDSIIVGLSGGADSVSLTHILYKIKDLYDLKIYAVHLNHLIRGNEAIRDEEHSREFTKSLDIPFYSERIKVEEYAKEHGMSSEEAGRFLRYRLFNEVAKKVGANKIALAHNMNDQAETMLMRFFRGSGISGLGGIKPIREGKYIRPIIACSRREIEEYCKKNNLIPAEDSTNKESIYTRNRVRLELIPYIKEHFNPNIIESLYKNSEIFRDEDSYLTEISERELENIRIKNGLSINKFNSLNIAVKRRVLRSIIGTVKGNLTGIEGKHIEECIRMLEKGETGKIIEFPEEIICITEYDVFRIDKRNYIKDYEYKVEVPQEIKVIEEDIYISARVIGENLENFIDKQFIKYWDYDKIKYELTVRNRRNGDYIYPKGMEGKKKVKDIFIDKKIPKDQRDKIPLVAMQSEILWIVGIRDSKNYKVDRNTRRILEIKIKRGADYE
jgi:tRNA(Ile)-lysidine synthase